MWVCLLLMLISDLMFVSRCFVWSFTLFLCLLYFWFVWAIALHLGYRFVSVGAFDLLVPGLVVFVVCWFLLCLFRFVGRRGMGFADLIDFGLFTLVWCCICYYFGCGVLYCVLWLALFYEIVIVMLIGLVDFVVCVVICDFICVYCDYFGVSAVTYFAVVDWCLWFVLLICVRLVWLCYVRLLFYLWVYCGDCFGLLLWLPLGWNDCYFVCFTSGCLAIYWFACFFVVLTLCLLMQLLISFVVVVYWIVYFFVEYDFVYCLFACGLVCCLDVCLLVCFEPA